MSENRWALAVATWEDGVVDGHDDSEGDCEFCLGREAAHRGEPSTSNPYFSTRAEVGSIEWYESDHGLWDAGHDIGSKEPDRVPWYAQREPEKGS